MCRGFDQSGIRTRVCLSIFICFCVLRRMAIDRASNEPPTLNDLCLLLSYDLGLWRFRAGDTSADITR